jgi:hypothetical protein
MRLIVRLSRRVLFLASVCVAAATASIADESAPPIPDIEITSHLSSGPGSIRAAIETANETRTRVRIVSTLEAGTVVYVPRELPPLLAYGVELVGNGLMLKGGSCVREDGRKGCSGLVIEGPMIVVRDLRATGFMFDGISVRGGATDVRIFDCHAFDNLDDGIGISGGATNIVVENCKLERNGFRTKGKGILIFDYAHAILRNNIVRYNRDGVTVSRGARAELFSNQIVDNYDKGLGVSSAEAGGSGNFIARNGKAGSESGESAPNADGLRLGIDSTVHLRDTQILDNGDSGVVVLGTSRLTLEGGRIADNRGVGIVVGDRGEAELRGVDLGLNGGGRFYLEAEGKLRRSGAAPGSGDSEDVDDDSL